MKIAVIGAGGIGGYLGGLLARAGREVTFIARGEHLRAIRQRGLDIKSIHGDFHVPARATDRPQEIGLVDLVLFAVKSYDTEPAAEATRPLVGPSTAVLSLQNGVENERILERILGRGRVLGGVVQTEAAILEPGVVVQSSPLRRVLFGELSGEHSERGMLVEQIFRHAGLDATLVDDVEVVLWNKFLFICALAGLTALGGTPIGPVLQDEDARETFVAVMREVAAVGRAHGVRLSPSVVEDTLTFAQGLPPQMKSSLQRDLERGRRLEIDALHGSVVRLGRAVGVPTPTNRAIYAALKLRSQKR